jgi:hypothetical protein
MDVTTLDVGWAAPGPILSTLRRARGGKAETHAPGLLRCVARGEQIDCVLEPAPCGVVVAPARRQ